MDIKTKGFTMPNGDTHIFIPPSPTETERGGIKAKTKTTETVEVAVGDDDKLYVPGTDTTLTVENSAADAKATGDVIKELKNETKDISGKLSEPAEGLAVGKYFRVAQIDENGHAVLEAVDLPIASGNQFGVVRVQPVGTERGIYISSEGFLATQFASASQIDNRTNFNNSITPYNVDYAVKAAMCDGKGAAWTAEEQAVAQERMGIDKPFELIEEIGITEESVLIRDVEPDGTPYNFTSILIIGTTPSVSGSRHIIIKINGIWMVSFDFPANRVNYFAAKIYIEGGHLFSLSSLGAAADSVTNIQTRGQNGLGKFDATAMSRIETYNKQFPVGSEIKIYGVRA